MFDGEAHHHPQHHHAHAPGAHHISAHMNNDAIFDRFRKLGNWERIDFMCGLLDLCHPFEVRYLGTFVEELRRKDYDTLKKYEDKANTGDNPPKDFLNLEDKAVRANLVISLTLLSSTNEKGLIKYFFFRIPKCSIQLLLLYSQFCTILWNRTYLINTKMAQLFKSTFFC